MSTNIEELKVLASRPISEIAHALQLSESETLQLLINNHLYRGKFYKFNCPTCNRNIISLAKIPNKYCEHCTQTSTIAAPSTFTLANGKNITYDSNHPLQQEWLALINNTEGLVEVRNATMLINIEQSSTIESYAKPMFEVEWETGLKWIVDVFEYCDVEDSTFQTRLRGCKQWAKLNGFQYKLITRGGKKYSTWSTVCTNQKQVDLPNYEWMMMSHASAWAALSPSTRLQVGAVISSLEMDQIFAFGYNGDELGGSNLATCFSSDTFVHAEENCLLKCKTSKPARMFITHSPCFRCAQKIINAKNIKEVYYLIPYKDMSGTGLLIQNNIPVHQFYPTSPSGEALSLEVGLKQLRPNALI